MARDYGVPKSDITELLRDVLGVKDGKWENVKSKETVDYVLNWISGFERTKFPPSATDLALEGLTGGFGPFPKHTRLFFTSPEQVLMNPKLGGKAGEKLAMPFFDRRVTLQHLKGRTDFDSAEIGRLMGDNLNMMFLISQPEVVKKWWKDMTPKEKEVYKRSIEDPSSNEAQAVKIWRKWQDDTWNLWSEYGEEHTNRHMKEELEDMLGKLYNENYYVRRINPDVLESLNTIREQTYWEETRDLNIDQIVKVKIKKMDVNRMIHSKAFLVMGYFWSLMGLFTKWTIAFWFGLVMIAIYYINAWMNKGELLTDDEEGKVYEEWMSKKNNE